MKCRYNCYPIFILTMYLFISSCSKNGGTEVYGFSMNVNNKKAICTKNLYAHLDTFNATPKYLLSMAGTGDTCSISIIIKTPLPISSNLVYSDTTASAIISISYVGQNGQIYGNTGMNPPSFRIQIQELNARFIKGTFSGITTDYINNPDQRTITDGTFYLPFN